MSTADLSFVGRAGGCRDRSAPNASYGLLRRQTVERYAALVAARSPDPGGGSAAAVVAALAASCLEKVIAYTLSSERCRASWPTAQRALTACRAARTRALKLVDEDARAYRRVAEARSLPRNTPLQQERRRRSLLTAQRCADEVVCRIMETAASVAAAAAQIAGRSNRLLDGDLRCAIHCASAAAAAAADLLTTSTGALRTRAVRCRRDIGRAVRTATERLKDRA